MSVPKPQRSESSADFMSTARELAGYTVQKCINALPKRYTFYYGQSLTKLAIELYTCTVDANGRWPTNAAEAQERIRLLIAAHGKARSIVALVELANESVHFPSNVLQEWMRLAKTEIRLLKGVIKSDRERYRFDRKQTETK